MKTTTSIRIKQAEVSSNGVLLKPSVNQVYVPKTNWNGRGIKWYADKTKNREEIAMR